MGGREIATAVHCPVGFGFVREFLGLLCLSEESVSCSCTDGFVSGESSNFSKDK